MSHPYRSLQQVPPGYYNPYPQPLPPQSVPHPHPPLPQYPPNPQFQQQPPPPLPPPSLLPQTLPYAPTPPIHHPPPTQTRILLIHNAGVSHPHVLIIDPSTSTPLYTITSPKRSHLSSTPHLSIQSPLANNSTIATIRFHSTSDDIDLVIRGQDVKVKSSAWGLTSSHELYSKASGAGKLKWKDHGVKRKGNIRCTDGGGNVVARFEVKRWKEMQKEGRLELSPTVAAGGAIMDEVVVSGIAMVEFVRRHEGDLKAAAEVSGAAAEVSEAVLGG